MNRTHPALAMVGIAFHGGMMFVLPLLVGFIASLVLETAEVGETAMGLAVGAALVVGPVFVAQVAGVLAKLGQELRFLRRERRLDGLTLIDAVYRHLAIVTPQGYGVLFTGVVLVILSLGFKWASLGLLAVLSLVLFYWVVGASVFLSAFLVRTFSWGMGRRQTGIRRELSPAVVQTGEPVEERFHLTKVPIFPGYRLLIHDKLPEQLETESRYIATPAASRETVTLAGLLRRTPRGSFKVGPARVQYQDALGLTRVEVASLSTAELTVLPRIRPVRVIDPPRALDEEPDLLTIRHRQANEDYFRFRNYVSGDDTRRIHWKLSMRAGRLQVRLPESREISHRKILLGLDTYLPRLRMPVRPVLAPILDAMVEAWVSLADGMVRDGEHVTLVTAAPGDRGPVVERLDARRGVGSPWLELGARVQWQPRIDLAQLLAGDDGDDPTDLVVLSCRFAARPPAPIAGRRVTWIYLPPEDVLGDAPPGGFERWAGERKPGPWTVIKRSLLLPHAAGSTLNTPWRRGLDLARALQRDNQLKTARWHAVRASRRVQQALIAGPGALYKMEVGPRHYVLRGLKGLTLGASGRGRGAA